MKINILFFARIKEIFGEPCRMINVKEGASIVEVMQLLSRESEEFSKNQISLIFAVNENFETEDRILKDQDQLAVMMPMSGG